MLANSVVFPTPVWPRMKKCRLRSSWRRPNSGEPIPGRHVYAIDIRTGARFSAVTNVTGGFSIEVPPGKYRLEVELREGEAVVRNPGTIDINRSDLDSNIKVEVGASP